jgi:hypothetical protein
VGVDEVEVVVVGAERLCEKAEGCPGIVKHASYIPNGSPRCRVGDP